MSATHQKGPLRAEDLCVLPTFEIEGNRIPRHSIPERDMPADVAYQIIHDELMLDGNARMNLATFVTTWMEPQAEKLMAECFDKNMIDKDEYPQTAELEVRCVNMLSRLWHAPEAEQATGCSTTGSSEAAMLGGLALKRRWQQQRAAAGQRDGEALDRPLCRNRGPQRHPLFHRCRLSRDRRRRLRFVYDHRRSYASHHRGRRVADGRDLPRQRRRNRDHRRHPCDGHRRFVCRHADRDQRRRGASDLFARRMRHHPARRHDARHGRL